VTHTIIPVANPNPATAPIDPAIFVINDSTGMIETNPQIVENVGFYYFKI